MPLPLSQKTFKMELEFTVTMDELTEEHLDKDELKQPLPFLQCLQQALLHHEPSLIRHMLAAVQNKLQEYADYLAAQGEIKPLTKVARTLEPDIRDFFEQSEAQFAQITRPIRFSSMTARLNHSTIYEVDCCAGPKNAPRQVWADMRLGGEYGPLMEKMGVAETREPLGIKLEIGHYLMVRYLTRQTDWKSTVIIRVPDDPLQPGRQIWVYYTHMADPDGESYIAPDFPPGTREGYVQAGTLLGYQGNYSGTPNNPVGVHLHFSIVKDDGNGSYLNELEIGNTLDPSPYLGLPLNASKNPDQVPVCTSPGA